jgi:hypothetical protein
MILIIKSIHKIKKPIQASKNQGLAEIHKKSSFYKKSFITSINTSKKMPIAPYNILIGLKIV